MGSIISRKHKMGAINKTMVDSLPYYNPDYDILEYKENYKITRLTRLTRIKKNDRKSKVASRHLHTF
jgi:hypothetical protein